MREVSRQPPAKAGDSEFIMVPHRILDEWGPRIGLAAIGYYCWLRRHVNHEPGHPLHGYAWPSRRLSCEHFRCHHATLSRLEEILQAEGLLKVEPAWRLVARGEVAEEDLIRLLKDPHHSLVYRLYRPGAARRRREEGAGQTDGPAGGPVAAAATPRAATAARPVAAAAAPRSAAAATEKEVPEKEKP